jgi:nitrogen fixation/metabolism regulation signal transduction histidine kinase
VRFAKSEIEVTVQVQGNYLYLFVKDDGTGFSKEGLIKATSPYYSTDKGEHFGVGLAICTVLVKKHGGVLKIANGLQSGAVVSAVFSI